MPVFNSAEEQSFYIDFDNISREINFRAQTQTEQQADNVFFGMMETYRRIHIGHLRELAEEKHLEKQQQRFEQSSWEVNDPVEICKD